MSETNVIEYVPDCWVIIKITTPDETFYKVLAGWSGGYLDGDSWKLNSGITKVEFENGYYFIHGHSGSVYKCHKTQQTLRTATALIWEELKAKFPGNVALVDITDIKL